MSAALLRVLKQLGYTIAAVVAVEALDRGVRYALRTGTTAVFPAVKAGEAIPVRAILSDGANYVGDMLDVTDKGLVLSVKGGTLTLGLNDLEKVEIVL